MTPARALVRLQSGRRLDLLEPDPTSWTDSDLAIGLSRTYRWGGHSRWDLPLSVAQHSLLVLLLRQKLRPLDPLTRGQALRELLHDANEGLLSYDPISPVNRVSERPSGHSQVACRRRSKPAPACIHGTSRSPPAPVPA